MPLCGLLIAAEGDHRVPHQGWCLQHSHVHPERTRRRICVISTRWVAAWVYFHQRVRRGMLFSKGTRCNLTDHGDIAGFHVGIGHLRMS
jgi:hypothetical protein